MGELISTLRAHNEAVLRCLPLVALHIMTDRELAELHQLCSRVRAAVAGEVYRRPRVPETEHLHDWMHALDVRLDDPDAPPVDPYGPRPADRRAR
ncbi:MAG: hypothetical protein GWO16_08370 [Gammaproteobacteria bacterium]|nr:hypothetical protein [Gammaproteobacteria bacterium]NIR97963.1 hypothetical protein [Gammaproteobacteria bacterium]NIT63663.1 hypothetical protein [Gammaproteobacteria bacterium]NIV21521.1 hypothetical protein [Gammaproteobacteria bacterium]NIY32243.1 hypothetical protein [Gammaproteobacteria bacterium]